MWTVFLPFIRARLSLFFDFFQSPMLGTYPPVSRAGMRK